MAIGIVAGALIVSAPSAFAGTVVDSGPFQTTPPQGMAYSCVVATGCQPKVPEFNSPFASYSVTPNADGSLTVSAQAQGDPVIGQGANVIAGFGETTPNSVPLGTKSIDVTLSFSTTGLKGVDQTGNGTNAQIVIGFPGKPCPANESLKATNNGDASSGQNVYFRDLVYPDSPPSHSLTTLLSCSGGGVLTGSIGSAFGLTANALSADGTLHKSTASGSLASITYVFS